MPSYQRDVTIDGQALRQMPWFEVDTIRLDETPDRVIEKTSLADTDGERIMSQQYGSKPVIMKGHFHAPNRWDYEQGRDKLLMTLNKYSAFEIVTEQSGEQRAFEGTYQNCQFEYKELGFCIVTINFQITGAFGKTVQADKPIDALEVTENLNRVLSVGGSANALPIITMNLRTLSTYSEKVPFVFEFLSRNVLSRIEIDRIWRQGDVLVINSVKKTVRVNGEDVDYTGVLPEILGETTMSVHDDALSRNYELTMEYNRRWL